MCSNGMALLEPIWVAGQTNNERSQNSLKRVLGMAGDDDRLSFFLAEG